MTTTTASLLRAFSFVPMFTGAIDLALGADAIAALAAPIHGNIHAMAVADSQIRFLGTMWAAYGAMLYWVSGDLRGRKTPLGILAATMFIGGLGRLVSGLRYGLHFGWMKAFIMIELLGPLVYFAV